MIPATPESYCKQPAGSRLFAFAVRPDSRGFTLIELLVVLVIVGIILSFMSLSTGGDRRAEQMEREARRLMALLQLASDEAVERSEQLAIHVGENDYAFMVRQDNKWLPLEDEQTLRPRELPAGIEFKLELEENPPPGLTAQDADQPQIFLLSSGEMTPFTLTLFAPGTEKHYRIQATMLGRLELE